MPTMLHDDAMDYVGKINWAFFFYIGMMHLVLHDVTEEAWIHYLFFDTKGKIYLKGT